MSNFYNENDPKAAAWLRELLAAELIPAGVVDTRSIVDIKPEELNDYIQCHFFAGIGGWALALQLAGWPEDEPIFTASCPCQPFSGAGLGHGVKDARHLWPTLFSLIETCRPGIVIGEQVASKAVVGGAVSKSRRKAQGAVECVWIDGVFTDMEGASYTCGAADIPAAGVNSPNIRQRLWWVGIANGAGRLARESASAGARHGRSALAAGGTEWLADSEQPRLEGFAGNELDGNESGRIVAVASGPASASGRSCGLAESDDAERRPDVAGRNDSDRPEAGRDESHGESGERGAVVRLEHRTSNGGPNQAGGALSADAALAGWGTPRVGNNGGNGSPERATDGLSRIEDQVHGMILPSSPAETRNPAESRGSLNPMFSLWLMGFPVSWLMAGAKAMRAQSSKPRKASRSRKASKGA